MLTIEFNPPQVVPCPCCGKSSTHLVRYVRRAGDAHAVYLARFSTGHVADGIIGLVSLGAWGGKSSRPEDRVAVAFRLWQDEGKPQVRILDVADTPWKSSPYFGRPLSREEALSHPLCSEVFHITDHITLQDAPVQEYLRAA